MRYLLHQVEDVTEQRRHKAERDALLARETAARAEAEAERQKLHNLFMQAPVATAIHERPHHTFTFANPPFRALVGGHDVVGKPLMEALPELRGQGFETLFDKVMATGEPVIETEVPARVDRLGRSTSEDAFYTFVYAPRRNAAGEVDGVLQFASDVTEQVRSRHRAEALAERVRASELQLRMVTDHLPVLVSFVRIGGIEAMRWGAWACWLR